MLGNKLLIVVSKLSLHPLLKTCTTVKRKEIWDILTTKKYIYNNLMLWGSVTFFNILVNESHESFKIKMLSLHPPLFFFSSLTLTLLSLLFLHVSICPSCSSSQHSPASPPSYCSSFPSPVFSSSFFTSSFLSLPSTSLILPTFFPLPPFHLLLIFLPLQVNGDCKRDDQGVFANQMSRSRHLGDVSFPALSHTETHAHTHTQQWAKRLFCYLWVKSMRHVALMF